MASVGQFEWMPSGSLTKMLRRDHPPCQGEHPPGTGGTRLHGRGGGPVLASLSGHRRLWCVAREMPCCVAILTDKTSILTGTAVLLGKGTEGGGV